MGLWFGWRLAVFRYSLLTLFVVVLVLSVFAAALANPTETKGAFVFTSTLVVLSAATLTAIAKGRALPFVWGFAVMGWAYFAVTFLTGLLWQDYLLTHWPLLRLVEVVAPEVSYVLPTSDGPGGLFVIGHCLWTLILATIGGLVAIWLQRSRPPTKTN